MSINPKARDLTLKLDNSCNCSSSCCWKKAPKSPEEQKVYVNSKGIVEAFDPSKGDEATAVSRSVANLKEHINLAAGRTVQESEKVIGHVAQVLDDQIRANEAFTLEHIERVNQALQRYLI